MRFRYRHIALSVSILCISVVYSQETNDTTAKMLDEITVKADMQHLNAVSATYYPSRQAKRSAINTVDLLQRMAMNHIVINPVTKEVSTTSKEPVVIFIDYIKASDADLNGLRAADVSKVEYLDYPSDSRFQGESHVVNIIMHRYEYGGYTKLSEDVNAINGFTNEASVFSKFIYKRMTYDLYVGSDNVSSSHFGDESNAIFSVNGSDIERKSQQTSARQNTWNLPVSFRAIYDKRNMQISNSFGFYFGNESRYRTGGNLLFSPQNSHKDYSYTTSAPSTSRSLSWIGGYYFILPKAWSIYLTPTFGYSHNDSYSNYSSTAIENTTIENNAEEDAYTISMNISSFKNIKRGHSLSLQLFGSADINKVDYFGSNPSHSDNRNMSYKFSASYNLNHLNRFIMRLNVGLKGDMADVNGIRSSDVHPFTNISLSFSPTNKSSWQLSSNYLTNSISGALREENPTQLNELLFRKGNPNIRNFRTLAAELSYTYFPCNVITLQLFTKYLGWYNRFINVYLPYNDGKNIVRTFMNDGDYNRITAGLNITARMLSDNLVFQLTPAFSRAMSSGYYDMSHNHFSWNINAQYYIKDFNISAYYGSREYNMGIATGDQTRNSSYYYIQLGWSNNNWNLSFSAKNIFRNHYRNQWALLDTPYYKEHITHFLASYHSSLNLSVVYTFGYGKRINRGNEISTQYGAGSVLQ